MPPVAASWGSIRSVWNTCSAPANSVTSKRDVLRSTARALPRSEPSSPSSKNSLMPALPDSWRRVALGAAALAVLVAWGIAWQAPAIGTFHDDAVYIVTAKSLAEGHGYRNLHLPGEVLQTKY